MHAGPCDVGAHITNYAVFKNNLSSFVVFLRNFFMPSFTSTYVVAHCTACQADIGQITLRKFQLITVTGVPKQSINC